MKNNMMSRFGVTFHRSRGVDWSLSTLSTPRKRWIRGVCFGRFSGELGCSCERVLQDANSCNAIDFRNRYVALRNAVKEGLDISHVRCFLLPDCIVACMRVDEHNISLRLNAASFSNSRKY